MSNELNNDGVIKLCETLLKYYRHDYLLNLKKGDKRQIEKMQNDLDGKFMSLLLDVMKIDKEDIINKLEAQHDKYLHSMRNKNQHRSPFNLWKR